MSEMSLFLMLKHGDKIINLILMISKYRSMLWRFYYNLWLKGVSWIQLRSEKCHMIGLVWHSNTPLQPPYGTIKIISCNFFLYMWYFTKKNIYKFFNWQKWNKKNRKIDEFKQYSFESEIFTLQITSRLLIRENWVSRDILTTSGLIWVPNKLSTSRVVVILGYKIKLID